MLFATRIRCSCGSPVDSSIEKIKRLITQRDRVMNAITQLTVPVKELSECDCRNEAKELEKVQRSSLKALQKTKEAVEQLIVKTVQLDEVITKKVQQVQSIKGIGEVTAVALLAYTKMLYYFL